MEFPNLGQHCQVKSCNRLDFLPMKCDACSMIFCCDHYTYAQHYCSQGLQKDVQVPVCPLCNKPVPSKRGEQPDIAVSDHIDRDCQADPAIAKRKVYTNKCSVKGCKQKEIIKITCETCKKIYCLKHRHPSDHKCEEQKAPSASEAAGAAAIARAQNTKNSMLNWFSKPSCSSNVDRKPAATSLPEVSVDNFQVAMSEDEALAIALQNSLYEEAGMNSVEEDRRLAMILAESEAEHHDQQQRRPRRRRNTEENKDKCSVS